MKKITFIFLFLTSVLGFSQNLVTNGDFQTGSVTPWYGNAANAVDIDTNGGGAFVNQANVTAVSNPWDVNLSQEILLENGRTYALTFDAFTDAITGTRTILSGLGQTGAPYTSLTSTTTLTSTPQTFSYQITISYGNTVADRVLFDMGAATGYVFIDNVSVVEVTTTCNNGVQDGDETGVDCGGSCPACAVSPTVAAPVPTRNPVDVVSLYSDSYVSVATNFNPNWGQSGTVNTTFNPTGTGTNYAMVYTNFNYQGTYLTQTNAANMEYLHIDIWTNNATSVKVSPINNGTGVPEYLVNIPLVNGGWSSVDLPKSAFAGMTWDSVFQLKFDGQTGVSPSTIYLDNIYFWKTAAPSGTPLIGNFTVPAKNLGDAAFALTAPSSNSTGSFSYTSSNLAVATISGSTVTIVGAGTSIITATQAAAAPYISGSVFGNLIVTEVPLMAAPTPMARNAWDVISLYSNAYSNTTINDWSAGIGWGGLAPITDLLIAGNDTKKIAFGNFIGVDFGAGNHFDATNMTTFHMDFWIPSATDLTGKVLNPKFSCWTSDTSGETSSFLLTYLPSVNGSWASIDAPISTFTAGSSNPNIRNNVAQYILSSNLGVVYVDNIYLYRPATTMATDTFNTSNLKLYPIPASTSLTIEANSSIESIAIYNVLGQEVIAKTPMSNSTIMDVSNLENGLYFINSTIDGKLSTTKFIKN
ncbi:T9SS type A sorting domain-containing protein [Flavobacterium sp.]|uniref:T9SS type A sorting domain-containing protein n=1 Tax=Flavobacterium sp. TaxID=239 RepID=UPI003BED6BF7